MRYEYDSDKNKASNEPDVSKLQSELTDILEDAGRNLRRRDDYDDVRYARWEGQSDDGRKHEEFIGHRPIPWEGASDIHMRLADRLINEHVHMVSEAFFRSNMSVSGIETSDQKKAAYWRDCLAYFLEQRMLPELRREVEILAQEMFSGSPAIGVLGVYWQQETIMRMKTFSMQDVVQMVTQQGGDEAAVQQIMTVLQDPDMEEQSLALMAQVFVGVKEKVLKKGLQEFRETGQTKLPTPSIHENRPRFVAHRLYEDVFVDANCTELDRARVIMRREWLSETELRDKIMTEGFSEEFVEAILEKSEGQSGVAEYDYRNPIQLGVHTLGKGVEGDFNDLYEIFYAYQRQYDEDTNVPAIYCTAFSSHVPELYGKHEILEYGHNQMPFVLFTRERLSRSIFDSRGISELVATNQYEAKVQRDLRNDASQIGVIPPLLVNARRGGLNLLVQPASQITITRPDDLGWLQPPPLSQSSMEAESAAIADAERYFGNPEKPEARQLYQQCMVNRWLDSWREALSQALSLCQQYLDPAFVARITGGPVEEIAMQQEDIEGRFDLSLRFSVDTLNPEFMEKKLDAVTKLTQFDVTGALDRNKLLEIIAESIDPMLAKQVVMDKQTAAQKEIDDEQSSWVKIANEIEPVAKEGVNFELRSQTAQQIVQQSQEIQRKMNENPLVKQLADNRIKYLQFGMQQKENAQIGRVGVKPVMGQGGY
tara:strand:- start:16170 stop:18299 length:2130 start_codon:yes stop_codon:yes gene_type:complete